MKAYHGSQELKDRTIAEMQRHYELDNIIKGRYWEDGKGCAVGCVVMENITKPENYHEAYQRILGVPTGLADLQDLLFENLPNEKAKEFPLIFLKAIKPGLDLEPIAPKFHYFLLTEVVDCDRDAYPQVAAAIEAVVALCRRKIEGDCPYEGEWSAAWSAAKSAAESAACSAAWSAAESAAESAAKSAAESAACSAAWSAACSAACSAAWSAATSVARSAAIEKMADKLIELLEEAQGEYQ